MCNDNWCHIIKANPWPGGYTSHIALWSKVRGKKRSLDEKCPQAGFWSVEIKEPEGGERNEINVVLLPQLMVWLETSHHSPQPTPTPTLCPIGPPNCHLALGLWAELSANGFFLFLFRIHLNYSASGGSIKRHVSCRIQTPSPSGFQRKWLRHGNINMLFTGVCEEAISIMPMYISPCGRKKTHFSDVSAHRTVASLLILKLAERCKPIGLVLN